MCVCRFVAGQIVSILDNARRKYMANASISDLYALIYKQSVVLNEMSAVCNEMGLTDKAISLARRALAKNLEMGEFPPTHNDYESLVSGRIAIYDHLAVLLHYANNQSEAFLLSGVSLALAENLYKSSAKEQTKNGHALVRALVSYVQWMPTSSEISHYTEKIRDLCRQLGIEISADMAAMLRHEEHRATLKPSSLEL